MKSPVLAMAELSICPSHAGTVSKRRKQGSQNLHRWKSPRTLVLAIKSTSKMRALNESGVEKICNFQPISCHISETVQDKTKVTISD